MTDTDNGITPSLKVEGVREDIPAKTHPIAAREQEALVSERPGPIHELMNRQGIPGPQGLPAFADQEWELDEQSERLIEAIFAESDSAHSGAPASQRQSVG